MASDADVLSSSLSGHTKNRVATNIATFFIGFIIKLKIINSINNLLYNLLRKIVYIIKNLWYNQNTNKSEVKQMMLKFTAKRLCFVVDYDEVYLNALLENIGIGPKQYFECTKKVILYYATGKFNMKEIYTLIGIEQHYEPITIHSHVSKSIEHAVYSGLLKDISDYIQGVTYDYVYGFTNKQFVALIVEHLLNQNKISVTIEKEE